jgi:uncharacterized protein
MSLEEKISEQLISATKAGNKLRMETLRSIRAAIIEFNKSGAGRNMNSEDEINLLSNQAKKRKDAIEMYKKDNGQIILQSAKAGIEPIVVNHIDDELKIIGVVKHSIKHWY